MGINITFERIYPLHQWVQSMPSAHALPDRDPLPDLEILPLDPQPSGRSATHHAKTQRRETHPIANGAEGMKTLSTTVTPKLLWSARVRHSLWGWAGRRRRTAIPRSPSGAALRLSLGTRPMRMDSAGTCAQTHVSSSPMFSHRRLPRVVSGRAMGLEGRRGTRRQLLRAIPTTSGCAPGAV